MRGSVYYQTAMLAKTIFKEKVKKEERIDSDHENYLYVSSYKTMETYRSVWNNFFNYLKEHWSLKNCELITSEHIEAYFEYKTGYYPSKQYAEKISSALGKLETALNEYSKNNHTMSCIYDFSVRLDFLKRAKKNASFADKYRNRTYTKPELVINALEDENHKIAARIQLEGGARSEGVTLIRKEQLKGYRIDKITGERKGVVQTKEKGGKVGDVFVSPATYDRLSDTIENTNRNLFKIRYDKYAEDIRKACIVAGETPKGSHGFRWTFAQNRVRTYQANGYSYQQALQGVSWEMKHFRASITEHYLG